MTEEIQHQRAHPGRVIGQPRPIDPATGQEPVELAHRHDPAVHRRPAQHPGVQADLAVPLQAAPQPPGADPVEPHRVPAHRLVIAQRNPVVLHRVPLVPLPPRAGVGGGDEQTHHPGQQPADGGHRGSRRQPPAAAVHHTLDLLAPLPARTVRAGRPARARHDRRSPHRAGAPACSTPVWGSSRPTR